MYVSPNMMDTKPVKKKPIAKNNIVYILECQHKRFYVGFTRNFKKRYKKHRNGKGSLFTKKYKPIKVVKRFYGATKDMERLVTLIMMRDKGINYVRGADWCHTRVDIPQKDKALINYLIKDIVGETKLSEL